MPHDLPNELRVKSSYLKADTRVFLVCLTLLDFLISVKIFCTGL